MIATFLAAVEQGFADLPKADALMVFGSRSGINIEGSVSGGRAAASRDGHGWCSDGELLDIGRADDGRALIYIGEYSLALQMVTNEELHLVDFEVPED